MQISLQLPVISKEPVARVQLTVSSIYWRHARLDRALQAGIDSLLNPRMGFKYKASGHRRSGSGWSQPGVSPATHACPGGNREVDASQKWGASSSLCVHMAREHRASLPAGRGVGKRASSRMPLTTSVLGFWKGMQPLWLQGLGQPRLESLTFQLGRALMLGRSRLKRVYSVFFPFAGECRLGLTLSLAYSSAVQPWNS